MANLFRKLAGLGLLAALSTASAQDLPDMDLIRTLPINLDAESSEFDRKQNKLFFRGLKIRQGALKIVADEATASRLDFEDARWEFTGNVVIDNAGTTAHADFAEIMFRDHQIRSAVMQGEPVRFEQLVIDEDRVTEGKANQMEYDAETGVIRMVDNAWLSDSANEVSGNRIAYDLNRQYIIADAEEDGQVRMKIIPPENTDLSGLEDQIQP